MSIPRLASSSTVKPIPTPEQHQGIAGNSGEQVSTERPESQDRADISKPATSLQELSTNYRILARYPVAPVSVGNDDRLLVDVNQNTMWDFGEPGFWSPNTFKSLEPILDARDPELRLYAQENGQEFLTADDLDPSTLDVKLTHIYNSKTYQLTATGKSLSDLAREINPLKSAPNAEQVQWALAPRQSTWWDLYLFTPKS